MPGTLRNGQEVDLWRDGAQPVTYDKPELISAMYPDQRWRKYMRNVWLKKYKESRLYLGKWVCRSWNADHKGGESLKDFKIIFMREDSLPNRKEKEPRQVEIWTHDCFKTTSTTVKSSDKDDDNDSDEDSESTERSDEAGDDKASSLPPRPDKKGNSLQRTKRVLSPGLMPVDGLPTKPTKPAAEAEDAKERED